MTYLVILSKCDGVVIQLVGVNSSMSSKDFASVVSYVSLGLTPCLGTGKNQTSKLLAKGKLLK